MAMKTISGKVIVMAGRKARSAVFAPEVPAIYALLRKPGRQDVDARHKAGHDGVPS